jgi:Protein of unknown function (DUF1553)/Protein of unknown function (DUF1549)/Planctomycete cytochrome C
MAGHLVCFADFTFNESRTPSPSQGRSVATGTAALYDDPVDTRLKNSFVSPANSGQDMRSLRFMLIYSVLIAFCAQTYAAPVDFAKDVQPILERNCLKCHDASKRKGGLALVSAVTLSEGSNTGKVVVAGESAASKLIAAISSTNAESRMPPEGPALSAAEIAMLRTWIDQGADWPKEIVLKGASSKATHWAFLPITNPSLPNVKNRAWVRNGIDHFILQRLEKDGFAPSPEADAATLIRRLSFDLIGLPPSADEVSAFQRDFAAKPQAAYEQLVDRLLASPHYGERWGRHWLDFARYADSDGYEKDSARPWAWRYRDWVIHALNRDLPFDQFTIEQLAGDLLPDATLEQKIATGFHRNTLTNKEGGVDQEEFRIAAVVDRVNTTSKVWLGITVNCCQCHDHKYDPLSQREFYQLFGFFNGDREADIDAPLPNEEAMLKPKKEAHAKKRADLQKALDDFKQKNPKAPKTDPQLVKLTKALTDHDKTAPTASKAPTLQFAAAKPTHVLVRGDFLRKGVEVKPGTPSVLPLLTTTSANASRLDLARWIVGPDNPLTRRVIANWVWHKYFGRGLVATLEDFGTQGQKPSHPELLDYLATQMLEKKWRLKELHKFIVMSATYRQSSRARPDFADRDPLNVLLARQNRLRLEAEQIRDTALASSGLLTRTVGGASVRPPQPPGISELTYAGSAKWSDSLGPDRYRRGLYIWFQRTSPYPMLMTFDSSDGVVCTVKRDRSNTPLQALTLLNDVVFVECAQELGCRTAERDGDSHAKLEWAFRQCLGRSPGGGEMERLTRLFDDLHDLAKASPVSAVKLLGKRKVKVDPVEAAAWVALSRAIMNLDEFVMRE